MEKNVLTIKEVCSKYNLSPVYVRRMILQGKLLSTKVEIGNNTMRHEMKVSDVEEWRKKCSTKSHHRSDGRNKYTLYGTQQEVESLKQLLKSETLKNVELKRSNPPKKS